jgi:hypothetical protein
MSTQESGVGALVQPRAAQGRRPRLRVGRQVAVHVVDLLLEALVQHLVRLVQHQRTDRARAQRAPLDHVEHAAGRARHDVRARLQLAHVLACGRARSSPLGPARLGRGAARRAPARASPSAARARRAHSLARPPCAKRVQAASPGQRPRHAGPHCVWQRRSPALRGRADALCAARTALPGPTGWQAAGIMQRRSRSATQHRVSAQRKRLPGHRAAHGSAAQRTDMARPPCSTLAGRPGSERARPSARPGVLGREPVQPAGAARAGQALRTQAGAADACVRADLGKVADRQDGLCRLRGQLPRRRQDQRLHPAAARRSARQLQGSHRFGLGPCAARHTARPARVRSLMPRRRQARTQCLRRCQPDCSRARLGACTAGPRRRRRAAARIRQPARGRAGQRALPPPVLSRPPRRITAHHSAKLTKRRQRARRAAAVLGSPSCLPVGQGPRGAGGPEQPGGRPACSASCSRAAG